MTTSWPEWYDAWNQLVIKLPHYWFSSDTPLPLVIRYAILNSLFLYLSPWIYTYQEESATKLYTSTYDIRSYHFIEVGLLLCSFVFWNIFDRDTTTSCDLLWLVRIFVFVTRVVFVSVFVIGFVFVFILFFVCVYVFVFVFVFVVLSLTAPPPLKTIWHYQSLFFVFFWFCLFLWLFVCVCLYLFLHFCVCLCLCICISLTGPPPLVAIWHDQSEVRRLQL